MKTRDEVCLNREFYKKDGQLAKKICQELFAKKYIFVENVENPKSDKIFFKSTKIDFSTAKSGIYKKTRLV